jgi:hypothetical protein
MNHWVADDDDNDGIPDPGEDVELQIARRNPTDEEARDVNVTLDFTTPDDALEIKEDEADYDDISAHEVAELSSSRVFEFEIGDAGDMSYSASASNSVVTATTLRQPGARWIPDAFVDGTLNPNTGQAETYTITGNDIDTITVDLNGSPDMDTIASDGDPFEIEVEGAPLNSFEIAGHPVEFTLSVFEDSNDPLGEETFTMIIGGIVRYMRPEGYDDLMDTISDRTSLGANNDGDGIPEPGETIEINITLKNVTDEFRVEEVEVDLDTDDNDVDIDNGSMQYDIMRAGEDKDRDFQFTIDDEFEGNKITFELRITGDIDRYDNDDLGTQYRNEDLGMYEFVVPVGNSQ